VISSYHWLHCKRHCGIKTQLHLAICIYVMWHTWGCRDGGIYFRNIVAVHSRFGVMFEILFIENNPLYGISCKYKLSCMLYDGLHSWQLYKSARAINLLLIACKNNCLHIIHKVKELWYFLHIKLWVLECIQLCVIKILLKRRHGNCFTMSSPLELTDKDSFAPFPPFKHLMENSIMGWSCVLIIFSLLGSEWT